MDDQEKALRFYTEVLGFNKKADFSNGPFRSAYPPEHRREPEGAELQLALNDNPAARPTSRQVFFSGRTAIYAAA